MIQKKNLLLPIPWLTIGDGSRTIKDVLMGLIVQQKRQAANK